VTDAPLAPHKILVIDDDPQVRGVVGKALEMAGAAVQVAGGGREGLALARLQVPALVLLDLSMPDLDGWEVLRELRARPETAFVPVALLTGANDCASYTRSRQHDVAAFISKPFRLAELTSLCRRILHSRIESQKSEWLSGCEMQDAQGRSLGPCVVLDRDDDGAMLEMERAPQLSDHVTLAGGEPLPLTGEVRWVRAVGQRFHVGLRFDK
jgi:CheY-like chemotaxis protein